MDQRESGSSHGRRTSPHDSPVAAERDYFTTDDVWRVLGQPLESRAMGAVMQRAARAGVCARTNMTKDSDRPVCHRNTKRVWRSLLRDARARDHSDRKGGSAMTYEKPEVTRLGSLSDLTAQDGLPNADVPLGPVNTAHCDNQNPDCAGVLS